MFFDKTIASCFLQNELTLRKNALNVLLYLHCLGRALVLQPLHELASSWGWVKTYYILLYLGECTSINQLFYAGIFG